MIIAYGFNGILSLILTFNGIKTINSNEKKAHGNL